MYMWWIVWKAFWDLCVEWIAQAKFQSEIQSRGLIAAQVALRLSAHTRRQWSLTDRACAWKLMPKNRKGAWLIQIAPWFKIDVQG